MIAKVKGSYGFSLPTTDWLLATIYDVVSLSSPSLFGIAALLAASRLLAVQLVGKALADFHHNARQRRGGGGRNN